LAWDSTCIWAINTSGTIKQFTTEEEPPNEPPNPPTITGKTNGQTGVTYDYNFVSTDPEGNFISFFVNWGDDTTSGWTEFVFSGTIVTLPHTWNVEGTYTIQAKLKHKISVFCIKSEYRF